MIITNLCKQNIKSRKEEKKRDKGKERVWKNYLKILNISQISYL
jgi:hypothetical protein